MRYWTTMGFGLKESRINTYDHALWDAGLADYNMQAVTSVPPLTRVIPKLIDGITYLPEPNSYPDKFKKYQVDLEGGPYLKLVTSWTLDLVMAASSGTEGQIITAAIGLGKYTTKDKSMKGVFAVEDHDNMSVNATVDRCFEILDEMISMRNRIPLKRTGKAPEPVEQKYRIGQHVLEHSKENAPVYGVKATHYHPKYDYEVNVARMEVPEGLSGTVLSCMVYDPFTEINA